MKTKYSKFITAGLAAAIIAPALALEGPADDAPPPQATKQQTASLPRFKLPPADQPEVPAVETAPSATAFLGVVSAELPEVLAEHLGLRAGEGVIVRAVCPDSPAAGSGIAVNDVITSVAGTPIHAQEDLSARITAHQAGDSVDLGIIRKGAPTKVSVTLGSRPEEIAMESPHSLDQMNLDNLPEEMADHIRDAIGGIELKLGGSQDELPPEIEEAIGAIQKRMLRGQSLLDPVLPPMSGADVTSTSSATFRMSDNDGSIEVKSTDGSKDVTVRDLHGNVAWSGPWNSEQDRAAAPDEVRQRMESLNLDSGSAGSGLKFRLNSQAEPDN